MCCCTRLLEHLLHNRVVNMVNGHVTHFKALMNPEPDGYAVQY